MSLTIISLGSVRTSVSATVYTMEGTDHPIQMGLKKDSVYLASKKMKTIQVRYKTLNLSR